MLYDGSSEKYTLAMRSYCVCTMSHAKDFTHIDTSFTIKNNMNQITHKTKQKKPQINL